MFCHNFSKVLQDIIRIDRVSWLNLSKNRLGDTGVADLSKSIRRFNFLVHLDVSSNCISPKGFKSLGNAISLNNSITELNVSTLPCGSFKNRIDASSFFAALEDPLSVLQCLNVAGTSLGVDGALAIFSALICKIDNLYVNSL